MSDSIKKYEEMKEEMSYKDEMKMHLKQYRDGNIDGNDLANAFEEMLADTSSLDLLNLIANND